MSETAKLLLGPVLALLPILAWETLIKPWRSRLSLAKAMRIEAHVNLRNLLLAKVWRELRPEGIIVDFSPSTAVFNALAKDITELPPDLLRDLLRLYERIDYLKQVARVVFDFRQLLHDDSLSPKRRESYQRSVRSALMSFDGGLKTAVGLSIDVREGLTRLLDAEAFESIERLRSPAELESAFRREGIAKIKEMEVPSSKEIRNVTNAPSC